MSKGTASMERRFKERLIGASILVVIIVGIVPEFLSGPQRVAVAPPLTLPDGAGAADGVRNVTVDLATRKATAAAESSGAHEQSGDDNGGTAAPPLVAPPVAVPQGTTAAVAAPASAADASPAAASPAGAETTSVHQRSTEVDSPAHRSWSVQVGSFASKANADRLMHQLKAQGLPMYVLSSGAKAQTRFKVRAGPWPDRGSAERSLAKLKAQGLAGSLVAPEG